MNEHNVSKSVTNDPKDTGEQPDKNQPKKVRSVTPE